MGILPSDTLRNNTGALVVWATVVQNKASNWPPSLQVGIPSPVKSRALSGEPYYYCSGLADNHPNKRIPVSAIERQLRCAQQLTATETQVESHKGVSYPHRFHNYPEALSLTTNGPWLEFPVYKSGVFQDHGHAGVLLNSVSEVSRRTKVARSDLSLSLWVYIGSLGQFQCKVANLCKGKSRSRRHCKTSEDDADLGSHTFDARWRTDTSSHTPKQDICAYQAGNGFDINSDAKISTFFHGSESTCSSRDSVAPPSKPQREASDTKSKQRPSTKSSRGTQKDTTATSTGARSTP
ncbi:hypothetical protein B0I37DRAFT_354375 [Chaetomium sp. MPI-CAGE-AT-0009]|nr:hypothetical protein B0I37DRAFT_354375 [Chaetomium sp. MPI-CAGE-AT-0009]